MPYVNCSALKIQHLQGVVPRGKSTVLRGHVQKCFTYKSFWFFNFFERLNPFLSLGDKLFENKIESWRWLGEGTCEPFNSGPLTPVWLNSQVTRLRHPCLSPGSVLYTVTWQYTPGNARAPSITSCKSELSFIAYLQRWVWLGRNCPKSSWILYKVLFSTHFLPHLQKLP